jgi:hypothetical protein
MKSRSSPDSLHQLKPERKVPWTWPMLQDIDWRTMGGVTQLKIKENADHAGLSSTLILSKLITSPRPEPSSPSPNPTSSIAHGWTTDTVMEAWTSLSSTPRNSHSRPKPTTNILPRPDSSPASTTRAREKLEPLHTLKFQKAPPMLWRPPLTLDLSLLPSKPIKMSSINTPVESSPVELAEPPSITESSLLDTVLKINWILHCQELLDDQVGRCWIR